MLKCTFLLVVLASLTEGQGVIRDADSGNGFIWAVNRKGYTMYHYGLEKDHRWHLIDDVLLRMSYVTVSPTGVVYGADEHNDIYVRMGINATSNPGGSYWHYIGGNLKLEQLSAGNNSLWGIQRWTHKIYYRSGITASRPEGTAWNRVDGKLTFVSVGPSSGSVWGVNHENQIWYRTGVRGPSHPGSGWKRIEGWAYQVSVGYHGVYHINRHGELYYRKGTFGDKGNQGTAWTKVPVPARMRHVSSRTSGVICVSLAGDLYVREGTSQENPTGHSWTRFQ